MFDTLSKITELREARGWSTYHLAKLSCIPQSTIATWYQKNLCPPIDKIEILCNTFGITLADFFRSAEHPLTEEQEELLQKWSLLTESEKTAIFSVINEFTKKKCI